METKGRSGPGKETEDLKAKVGKYLERAKPLFAGLRKTADPKAGKILDSAMRYYADSKHFYGKGEYANALAALEYAEGWMDAGKEMGILYSVEQ